jgi:hypothetical protein
MPFNRNALIIAILLFWHVAPFSASLPDPTQASGASRPLQNPVTFSHTFQADQHSIYLPIVVRRARVNSDLADGWYLMVDDGHLRVVDGVERVYHPFQKYRRNPILVADQPWEGRAIQLYGTVLPGFRMWYSSYNVDGHSNQILYAESSDGIHWEKPGLGETGANALLDGKHANLVSVIYTQHDPNHLYKLMTYQEGGFYGYWSLDGIQTTPYADNPLFSNGGDVAQFYWDPNTSRYRGTAKGSKVIREVNRKIVRIIESLDFVQWMTRSETFEPDLIDDEAAGGLYPHFYGMPVFPLGEQYLGLLWLFKARDQAGTIGPVDVQLVSSHDGISWIREEGERPPILDLGPAGAWDDGQIYTATQPIQVGDELWLYYSGCDQEHGVNLRTTDCGIGLARVHYQRLASLEGTGTILTELLTLPGPELQLNYDGRGGSIRVELWRDEKKIPGYEAENCALLSENKLDQSVTWAGQTGLPSGPLQIRFYLQDSALYAFR